MNTIATRRGTSLTQPEIDLIRSTYRNAGTSRAAAAQLGISRETVNKYTRDLEPSRPHPTHVKVVRQEPAKRDLAWQEDAACRGYSTETFFPYGPTDHETLQQAKAVCRTCPVAAACLAYAQATHSVGVFGGRFIAYDGKRRTSV